ncbi:hypothetical protein MPL1032_220030 [Mesorhizobium plurifarium]|uniref:Uncharacterized protein n=1 Tax=Mesorhizobium plurifarium TaxID=69974 RepID=A0A0K2VZG2_MESPL|nr:hypothetical protein MPL1032_220030 [Mesorhizobium plurifarium]
MVAMRQALPGRRRAASHSAFAFTNRPKVQAFVHLLYLPADPNNVSDKREGSGNARNPRS